MQKTSATWVLSAALLMIAGCGGGGNSGDPLYNLPVEAPSVPSPSPSEPEPTPKTYNIRYVVGGKARNAYIKYFDAQGQTHEETSALPWERSFNVTKETVLYLMAQNAEETGSISVDIFVDGMLFKEGFTDAPFGSASASGNCCSSSQ